MEQTEAEAPRRILIAGNWKMNLGGADAIDHAVAVAGAAARHVDVDVVIGPPFTCLAAVKDAIRAAKLELGLAAQNMHAEEGGAYTGEISGAMLKDCGVHWVILGHSERRQLFDEDDETVGLKVASAFAQDLSPIVCVGETLAQREAGETLEVVKTQLDAVLDSLLEHTGEGVVAYEPVWAIGTGKTASPEDAQEVHAAIRAQLADRHPQLAAQTRLLYGGSVKPQNAEGLLTQPDIDGALVGGASLQAESFAKIVEIGARVANAEQKDQQNDQETE